MRSIECDGLDKQGHSHPLVVTVLHWLSYTRENRRTSSQSNHTSGLSILLRPDARLDVLVGGVGEGEGGVCPAVGVEDARGDPLDVTSDGVRHQLDRRDQEAGGHHQT